MSIYRNPLSYAGHRASAKGLFSFLLLFPWRNYFLAGGLTQTEAGNWTGTDSEHPAPAERPISTNLCIVSVSSSPVWNQEFVFCFELILTLFVLVSQLCAYIPERCRDMMQEDGFSDAEIRKGIVWPRYFYVPVSLNSASHSTYLSDPWIVSFVKLYTTATRKIVNKQPIKFTNPELIIPTTFRLQTAEFGDCLWRKP